MNHMDTNPNASGVRRRGGASRTPLASSSNSEMDLQLAAQERRREIARMGAYAQHAKHDARETTRGAMEARMRRYRAEVDPTGELAKRDPRELAKRVESQMKLEMARVRLARRQKQEQRMRLEQQVLRTPSDDIPQLAREIVALEMNTRATRRLETAERELQELTTTTPHQKPTKTEAASALTEAAPKPHSSRKQPKIVSSGGSVESVTRAPRRRQTSTPKVPTTTTRVGGTFSTPQKQKKAAKTHDHTHVSADQRQ